MADKLQLNLLTCAHSATPLMVPAMLHSQSAGERRHLDSRSLISSINSIQTSETWCEMWAFVVSYWCIHQQCRGRGSSTELYICHRPGPPHNDGTHTGPEKVRVRKINYNETTIIK